MPSDAGTDDATLLLMPLRRYYGHVTPLFSPLAAMLFFAATPLAFSLLMLLAAHCFTPHAPHAIYAFAAMITTLR